ncbi:FkbM family methyltransferase [Caldicellulosiruptor naganoensis]|uniref:FkbM family methyltransferase n=1 Tax=Caldicellulosiruptor naganoensis TaxID=29324 RepID=A0ABY7BE09_9FIRM|nr:FkbM family methyltransferase [Caldicellulosiruptor naganoensis]WAM30839.1 FkbM family methyltransferase [Caldicellulosiruptor naganoensis]
MNENIESKVERIKKLLNELVEKGELDYALEVINKCENVIKNDIEIISMKGIIYYAKNEIEKAEEIFKKGLLVDATYTDFYYNLGCVYELKEEYEKAAKFFARALEFATGDETIEIGRKLNNILYKISTPLKDETKIAFFVKPGLDSFLNDIILGLMDEYFVRKIVVTDFKQIDEGMQWADICWFEWCDELVIYGSRHELARGKKLICRVHSYEAFTDYIFKVNWDNIDKIIFVAKHIFELVNDKLQGVLRSKSVVIPNGIDLKKFTFEKRNRGFNLAYVGYINYKKGPMLLLQLFKALHDKDNRYKLHIAGEFQDERYLLYFKQMMKEWELEDSIVFEGWQNDINKWLEDKNYVICSSILESQNISIMEAMAKGIKPVIHNFVGAREIYPSHLIWTTIDEAIDIILSENYDSVKYREFIEKNYSLENKLCEIKKLLESILHEQNPEKIKFITKVYFENEEYKFYLPNLSDYIQKVMYKTSRFYEEEMLRDIKQRIKGESIVIDIGANIGNHTVFIASLKRVKKVVSIEPYEYSFKILLKNIELNGLNEKVVPLQIALGNSNGRCKLIIENKNNLGGCKVAKDETGNITLETLDKIVGQLNLKRVDLIKIDVEGMELEVLEGSIQTLLYYKPILYVEILNENFSKVNSFLNNLGYKATKVFNATPTYLYAKVE